MKKLLLSILTTACCLSVVTGYAQTHREEILRLKVENAQLKQQNTQLKNQAGTSVSLKPYYQTIEIQNLCEKYPAAKRKIEEMARFEYINFQLTKAWVTQEKPINLPFLKHDYKTFTVFHGRGRAYRTGTIIIRFPVAHDGKLLP